MKKRLILMTVLLLSLVIGGCATKKEEPILYPDGCLLHIGLVTGSHGVDDNAFNQLVWSGIERFAQENNMSSTCYDYLQAMDESEYIPYLTQLAEENYDLIIAADYDLADEMNQVASIYPEHKFLLIDNESSEANVVSALFNEQEGSYLAGVAAALKAQEMEMNTVGFIGGKQSGLMDRFQAGFEQGVYAINAEMTILINYTNDYYDEEIASNLALNQFESGAAVIYHATGDAGKAIINEAKGRMNVYVIGVDHDQYEEGMTESGLSVVLTSMLKKVDQASYLTCVSVLNDKFKGGVQIFDLANESVGLELSENRNLSKEQIELIQTYSTKILNQEIEISIIPQLEETIYEMEEQE